MILHFKKSKTPILHNLNLCPICNSELYIYSDNVDDISCFSCQYTISADDYIILSVSYKKTYYARNNVIYGRTNGLIVYVDNIYAGEVHVPDQMQIKDLLPIFNNFDKYALLI